MTQPHDNTFGVLRSLCQLTASRHSYLQIMELLADAEMRHDPHFDSQLLPYTLDHLRSWPTHICTLQGPFARNLIKRNALTCQGIKALDLSGLDLSGAHTETLANATNLSELRVLNLSQCNLGFAEISTLCAHPHARRGTLFGKLDTLDVSDNRQLDRRAFRLVLHAPWMPHVRELSWRRNNIQAYRTAEQADLFEGLSELALHTLDLLQSALSRHDLQHLAQTPALVHIRRLCLSSLGDRDDHTLRIGQSSTLKQLDHLTLDSCTHAQIEELFTSPLAARLRHLNLLYPETLVPLYKASREDFPALESLQVTPSQRPETWPDTLGDLLLGLRSLTLHMWHSPIEQLHEWLLHDDMSALQELSIKNVPLGDMVASALVLQASKLESLTLHNCELGADFIHVLQDMDRLNSLHTLDLGGNAFGDDVVRQLIKSPQMKCLHTLKLTQTQLGNKSVQAMASSQSLPALSRLDLSHNALDEATIHTILHITHWEELRHLDLSHTGLQDTAVASLTSAHFSPRLHSLKLGGNALTDRGLRTLLRTYDFLELSSLDVSHNAFTPRGLTTLARSYKLARLTELCIELNHHTRSSEIAPGVELHMQEIYIALLASEHLRHLHALDWPGYMPKALKEALRPWRTL